MTSSAAGVSSIRLHAKASSLARAGRLWFFADDVLEGDVLPPRLVRLADEAGRDLGLAFTGAGKIAVRRAGGWPGDGVPDRETFFGARLEAAIAARGPLVPEAGVRLVHGESDWLPGLVVDRYADVVVLQVTSAFVEQALDAIVPRLVERTGAAAVIARNDVGARRHEALDGDSRLLHGRRVDETAIVEGGLRHVVRPFDGHKTGFYLDQRPARALVRELAVGRTVLDLFSYQGAFALHALAGGARAAVAVDQSEAALARAVAGARANGLEGLTTIAANAFDHLRTERDRGGSHDLIVLDPPAFAKSRRELRGAERGYRDLNRLALRLLAPGGHLLTCSCSHHVSLPRFEDIVRQAAAGLPFRTVLRRRLGAGDDHPAVVTHPESEYLKVLLLQRCDG
ncbi:MAG: class I SAM-dependent rRNA methyltransferase [Planctomycetes bacterium]|nr:class I SAM-dependent rRNA methyltransferase [Planctomycetota bacterium]